jgi:hypothetical protein
LIKKTTTKKSTEKTHLLEIEIVATFTTHARECLTTLIGHTYSIDELLTLTPTTGEEIFNFVPKQEIIDTDEDGDYCPFTLEVSEFSSHLEETLLGFQQTFLTDVINLAVYLRQLQPIANLEPVKPEIRSLLQKLTKFPGAPRLGCDQLVNKIKQLIPRAKRELERLLSSLQTYQINQPAAPPQHQ